MKVLHLLDYSRPNISGYSSRSDAIIRSQQKIGIETFQMTSQRYQQFDQLVENVEGITYYRTNPSNTLWSKIPIVKYFSYINVLEKRIEELAIELQPDILQAHSPLFNAIAARRVGTKLNIPVAYEIRALWEDAAVDTGKIKQGSVIYKLIKSVEQWAMKRVDIISCICQGLKQDLLNRGFADKKVFVTPNGVDIDYFRPINTKDESLEQELNLQDKKVVAFIGSFFKYEGLDQAIDAMTIINAKNANVHLLLVGGGNELENLKQQVKKLSLEHCVSFVNRVEFSQVQRYYSLADFMVFPRESIRLTELVTPLKPLEAMAQCKVVIASPVNGHKELVTNNETGFIYQPNTSQALANKILSIIDKSDMLVEIQKNGLQFVQQKRTWDCTAAQYLDAYKRVLSNHE